jgi:hypothetical protein
MALIFQFSRFYQVTILPLLLMQACSLVGDDTPLFEPDHNDRRMYVNDRAANDSLNAAVFRGMTFTVQPGAEYRLVVKGMQEEGHKLHLFRLFPGWETEFPEAVTGKYGSGGAAAGLEFVFQSPSLETEQAWGQIRDPGGYIVREDAGDVEFTGKGNYNETSFGMTFHFMAPFSQYPADSIRALAGELQKELAVLYSRFDGLEVTMEDVYVYTASEPVTVRFPSCFNTSLDLQEGSGKVNVVFVEEIKRDSGSGTTGKTGQESVYLGISPREARAMDTNPENLVFISLQGLRTYLPFTLAHETGHFFGLRHTVFTIEDQETENDLSNAEDGFDDTPVCSLGAGIVTGLSQGGGFCVRTAASPAQLAFCDTSHTKNLMFPHADSRVSQDYLTPQQVKFLQSNIGLIPH